MEAATVTETQERSTGEDGPLRLYRHPRGKIAGVAAGLAGYFDIDPVIARLLFVVAAISGLGIPAYLLCWVVIPKAHGWPPAGYRGSAVAPLPPRAKHSLLPGFLAIVLAALISAGTDGLGELLLPAALVGFGIYLLTRSPTAEASGVAASRSVRANRDGRDTREDGAPEDPHADSHEQAELELEDEEAPPVPPSPRSWLDSRRLHNRLTPTVLGILVLALALVLLAAHFDWFHISVLAFSLGALTLVVAGLFGTRLWGPAPGLLPLAGALSVVALGSLGARQARSHLDWEGAFSNHAKHEGGVGSRRYVPQDLTELAPSYSLGMGELVLDLQDVDFKRQQREVSLQLGLGELKVIVPADLDVVLQGSVGIGEPLRLEAPTEALRPGAQLIVDMHLGIGEGHVVRAESKRLPEPAASHAGQLPSGAKPQATAGGQN